MLTVGRQKAWSFEDMTVLRTFRYVAGPAACSAIESRLLWARHSGLPMARLLWLLGML